MKSPDYTNSPSENQNLWFISKYCRLPSHSIDFEDGFQVKGSYPARAFSILRELSKSGYDCTLFVARHDYNYNRKRSSRLNEVQIIDGVRVVFIRVIPFKRAKSIRRIISWLHFELRLLLLNRKDLPNPKYLVSSSLSILSALSGLYFKWQYKCKLIFEVRDVWPMVLTENGGFSKFNPFVRVIGFVEWLGYRFSDQIVATMPNLEPHVRNVLGFKKSVECVPMGLPDEMQKETNEELTEEISNYFDASKFTVCYAGSVGIDNALDTFMDVVQRLSDRQDIFFLVVGKGDLLEKYRRKCSGLSNIAFTGHVPSSQVQSILQKSSAVYFATHPSKVLDYGQSLNKLVDYMYSGRPIIASHSGYPSMINEADCGVFLPAGDVEALKSEILRMSDLDPTELREIGARGKRWIIHNRNYKLLAQKYASIVKTSNR